VNQLLDERALTEIAERKARQTGTGNLVRLRISSLSYLAEGRGTAAGTDRECLVLIFPYVEK